CVRQAVRTGLGLKAKINLKSVFDRKNYFYPDLPQGYQISQYKSSVVGEGEVIVALADGETIKVGIERLHLEQDAGKSLHDRHPRGGDAPVRPEQRRNPPDAPQGGGARLSLLPRSRPAATGTHAGHGGGARSAAAGTARRQEVALHARVWGNQLRRRRAGGRA